MPFANNIYALFQIHDQYDNEQIPPQHARNIIAHHSTHGWRLAGGKIRKLAEIEELRLENEVILGPGPKIVNEFVRFRKTKNRGCEFFLFYPLDKGERDLIYYASVRPDVG